jgi:integrase
LPTLHEFARRFLDGHARANRQKPSGIAAKETILRVHLVPMLGTRRLDTITNEHVQRLKSKLSDKANKTVNNVLTVLSTLLKVAGQWGVIDRMPCNVGLLPTPKPMMRFHDFDDYDRLVDAAHDDGSLAHLITLLGGDAGLRCGEIMALQRDDIDMKRAQIFVQRSTWKGHTTVPKGGRARCVPMTRRLAAALKEVRHVRGPYVLSQEDGQPLTQKIVQVAMKRAARKANVLPGVHILRHTFCSHLAMRGAPARAIQELAGHKDLATTQRYMHLSPAAVEGAIRLLDQPRPEFGRGDILETGSTEIRKSSR